MPTELSDRGLRALALVLVVGATASLLDTTIVSVALDTIARQLGGTAVSVQWVSSGYLLALALVIPLMGWGVDRFGAQPLWRLSLLVFLVGSVLCAATWSVPSLVAFRVVQGLGGGLILPLCQTILTRAAGPERLPHAIAVITIPGQLAPIVGPVVGGVIVHAGGWRWIFLINVPVCLLALAASRGRLPEDKPNRSARLDVRGTLLLPPGLVLAVFGLSQLGSGGASQTAEAWVALGIGVALLATFGRHAFTASRPLIDLRLLTRRTFTASALLIFLSGIAIFGSLYLLPLYYQQVRHAGVVETGLLLAPQGFGTALALLVGSRFGKRWPVRALVITGILISLIGTIPFTAVLDSVSSPVSVAALFVRGFGLGLGGLAMTATAYQQLRGNEIPRATSLLSVLQRLGGSLGTALLAVLLARPARSTAAAFTNTFGWSCVLLAASIVPALLLPVGRGSTKAT